jgi:hypothetical protein
MRFRGELRLGQKNWAAALGSSLEDVGAAQSATRFIDFLASVVSMKLARPTAVTRNTYFAWMAEFCGCTKGYVSQAW